MKIILEENVYEELVVFCESTCCKYCPFGETGYHNETIKCRIDIPTYWETEDDE